MKPRRPSTRKAKKQSTQEKNPGNQPKITVPWGRAASEYRPGLFTKQYFVEHGEACAASHHFEVHRKQIRRARLEALAQQTLSAMQSLQMRFSRVVGVVDSDHGSTLLPRGNHILHPPPNALEDPGKHRRFRFLHSDAGVNQLEWYFLGAANFGLPQHCTVAKGYSSIGKPPQFRTHGGLTPEETIVPHIEFKMAQMPDWIPIEVRYEGNPIRPRRREVLTLKVRNLNQTRLSEFQLTVQGRESVPMDIDADEEGTEVHDVAIQMPDTVHESELIIYGVATYIVHGRQTSEAVEITIPVRHIAIEAEIDKMFEE